VPQSGGRFRSRCINSDIENQVVPGSVLSSEVYTDCPAKQIDAEAVFRYSTGSRTMLVSNIESFMNGDYCELRANVETSSIKEPFHLWYRLPAQEKDFIDTENGDPFVAAMLLPAMKAGEPLQVTVPVSQRLLRSARIIQSIYHDWDRTLSEVPISAPVRSAETDLVSKQSDVGVFFSLGVDSFYVLLRNLTLHSTDQDEITHLISVHGFDVYYGNTALFSDVLTNGTKVAKTLDKETLHVATNLREFSERFVSWTRLYHGAALASIGLVLERKFKTIYIAASYQAPHLHPWGSHPLLDPLWSTESLNFVHEGCETGRVDKIRFIAKFPIAMETLRVCASKYNEYNCGRCEKCLRTMIGLHIAGALQKCKTLPQRIDIDSVRNLQLTYLERAFIHDLLNNLTLSDFDLALASALRQALSRGARAAVQEKIESELRKIAARRVGGVVATNGEAFFDQNKDDNYHASVLSSIKFDLERIGSSAQGTILDLGCGCGTFVKVCRDKGLDAIGVDPAGDLLEIAKLRNVGNYVIEAVGESIPFKERSFDVVTSNNVLEHVQNPRIVLRESFRVLKPGGVLWLSFQNYSKFFHEPHYRIFWIPLMPNPISKLYVRMRGRTHTKYSDSIQYATQRAARTAFDTLDTLDARVIELRNPRAKEIRMRVRAYCFERIRDPDKIETRRWRQIMIFLRWLGFSDRTLCRMCELFCLVGSFRKEFLSAKGNIVWVIEKQS
jgi:2-polyprenyl-3-methyl-5-hydroxy-6-metoxy-1,4-benzoquinol methylase